MSRPFDPNIPTLTEIVHPTVPPTPRPDSGASAAKDAPENAGADQEVYAQRLVQGIVQQLQGRVDGMLEHHLRDAMADVVQHALTTLTNDIRAGLQQAIETIVWRAVAAELSQAQPLCCQQSPTEAPGDAKACPQQ